MIVEFFGLPGSGKTYLANQMLLEEKKLFVKYQKIKKPRILRVVSILAFLKTWIFVYFLIKIPFSKSNFSLKLKIKRLKSLIYLDAYPSSKNENIVYDQHVLQNLIAFYHVTGFTITSKQLLTILNHFNFSPRMIFIYKKNEIHKTYDRFVKRKKTSNHNKTLLDSLNPKDLMIALNDLDAILESLYLIMKKEGLNIIYLSEDVEDVPGFINKILKWN